LNLPSNGYPGWDDGSETDHQPEPPEPEDYVELGDELWLSVTGGYTPSRHPERAEIRQANVSS
jgi:hypothetical protein